MRSMIRWPTSATAKLTFPRQNLLFHGKTYFSTAKLTFPRQNLLFYGKTYFLTAKLTFPRQNLLSHGKTYFSTAKLTFPSLAMPGLTSWVNQLPYICYSYPHKWTGTLTSSQSLNKGKDLATVTYTH